MKAPGRIFWWRLGIVVAVLLLWHFASGRLVNPMFISAPLDVLDRLWKLIASGKLAFHAGFTAFHALAGFLLGALAGTVVGVLLGRMQFLAQVLDPFLM
ncbi:MAG TPA: hypothetical protein VEA40_15175, partial [Ramlibacter sp.]|nr:hypothetical protein [Ramlibacter sp.]